VLEAAHRYIHQHRGGENPVPGGRRVRQSEKHVSVWEKPGRLTAGQRRARYRSSQPKESSARPVDGRYSRLTAPR
jgi:hypothetical protein